MQNSQPEKVQKIHNPHPPQQEGVEGGGGEVYGEEMKPELADAESSGKVQSGKDFVELVNRVKESWTPEVWEVYKAAVEIFQTEKK